MGSVVGLLGMELGSVPDVDTGVTGESYSTCTRL